jgi:hypothetical protein
MPGVVALQNRFSAHVAHWRQDRHWADHRIPVRSFVSGPLQRTILMMRKFAIALIATTMLVAPALAADAVKSTPAAPVAAASTAAPTVTSDPKTDTKTVTKTDKNLKTFKVSHRHPVRHMTVAKNFKHSSHVKTVKMSKPVKTVTATPAASPMWFSWTAPKTEKHLKVAHHHAHHMTFAKNDKHVSHVKTAKIAKPVTAVTAAPAASTLTPVASTVSKPAVKTIKASKDVKKIKVAHRHNVRHLTIAKNGKHVSQVKTAKVSMPVKHANVDKVHKQVVHEVKSNKVIVN